MLVFAAFRQSFPAAVDICQCNVVRQVVSQSIGCIILIIFPSPTSIACSTSFSVTLRFLLPLPRLHSLRFLGADGSIGMLIFPCASIPVVRELPLHSLRVLNAARYVLPTRSRTYHVPLSTCINLASDEDGAGGLTERARFVVGCGGASHLGHECARCCITYVVLEIPWHMLVGYRESKPV